MPIRRTTNSSDHGFILRSMMPRPTVLVAEPEPTEALSTRKLVLETGKFNVLTAHSTHEALATFNMFPNVSCVVLVPGEKIDCDQIGGTIKKMRERVPIVGLTPLVYANLKCADHTLSSHEPHQLLGLLRELFGDPRRMNEQ